MKERPTKRRGPMLWLAVRTWRFWVVILIVLPTVYVASFGPVCWWFALSASAVPGGPNFGNDAAYLSKWYWPIGWTVNNYQSLKPVFVWYSKLYGNRTGVIVPVEPVGNGGTLLWSRFEGAVPYTPD